MLVCVAHRCGRRVGAASENDKEELPCGLFIALELQHHKHRHFNARHSESVRRGLGWNHQLSGSAPSVLLQRHFLSLAASNDTHACALAVPVNLVSGQNTPE